MGCGYLVVQERIFRIFFKPNTRAIFPRINLRVFRLQRSYLIGAGLIFFAQPPEYFMHIGEFPLEFCFQFGYFLCQFGVGEGVSAELDKSAENSNIDLNSQVTIQDTRKH